jgi:hypothetical protein
MKTRAGALALLAGGMLAAAAARADEALFDVTVANGRFDPVELVVPADAAFKLRVTNRDAQTIEFESFELHRERVVQPGETITVLMPALAAGRYEFFDDFHGDTPHGAIVAK